jgi:hypothetical protein
MVRKNDYTKYMPPLEAIQMNEDGSMRNVDYQPERKVTFRDKLTNALLGVQAAPTDHIDISGDTINMGVSENPRVGGLLNDFASGYRENYNNRFNLNNFGDNDIDYDRKKGFGYRLGEGLGTLGRFVDSPLGRFTLAAGLNSALGYNNSLQEGLTAAVGRQNAQTADRVYRQQLSQMGYSEDDLNNITGNITPQIFKGLTDSFRLGNQRMTYGQLAMFDENIAEQVKNNPELINQFVPINFARDIYGKKQELAENKIANDKTKLAQNDRRLNILQQRVNQGAATAAEMSEYRQLKMEQIKLENDLYRKEIGNGGGGNGRPVGQTKSGIKYEVL